MLKDNVVTFIGCDKTYAEADTVIFGAPFDSTTSYRPGTRFASKAIRNESYGLETYSPYQDKDLIEDTKVFDSGDLELCFGDTDSVLSDICDRSFIILNNGKMPIMVGGEHLVTLGQARAVYAKHPDFCLVHFDAHTDLREDYLGNKLSHASVVRRVHDMIGDGRIFQFGIRSGEKSEFAWAIEHTQLNKYNLNGVDKLIDIIGDRPVYFTLDLDVLDPSVFCGTGTPEAGGVDFHQLLSAILELSKLNIVAVDMNELSPIYDASGASTALACKVLREILLAFSK